MRRVKGNRETIFFFLLVVSLRLQISWWNHWNLQVNILHGITFSEEHCTARLRRKLVLFWQSYECLEITHWAHTTGLLLSLTGNLQNNITVCTQLISPHAEAADPKNRLRLAWERPYAFDLTRAESGFPVAHFECSGSSLIQGQCFSHPSPPALHNHTTIFIFPSQYIICSFFNSAEQAKASPQPAWLQWVCWLQGGGIRFDTSTVGYGWELSQRILMSLLSTRFNRDGGIPFSPNLVFWEGSCSEKEKDWRQQQMETATEAAPELRQRSGNRAVRTADFLDFICLCWGLFLLLRGPSPSSSGQKQRQDKTQPTRQVWSSIWCCGTA